MLTDSMVILCTLPLHQSVCSLQIYLTVKCNEMLKYLPSGLDEILLSELRCFGVLVYYKVHLGKMKIYKSIQLGREIKAGKRKKKLYDLEMRELLSFLNRLL